MRGRELTVRVRELTMRGRDLTVRVRKLTVRVQLAHRSAKREGGAASRISLWNT